MYLLKSLSLSVWRGHSAGSESESLDMTFFSSYEVPPQSTVNSFSLQSLFIRLFRRVCLFFEAEMYASASGLIEELFPIKVLVVVGNLFY